MEYRIGDLIIYNGDAFSPKRRDEFEIISIPNKDCEFFKISLPGEYSNSWSVFLEKKKWVNISETIRKRNNKIDVLINPF